MDIQIVGPWIMLSVGTVTLLGAVWISVKRTKPQGLALMWLAGLAIMGIGIYGPLFLEPLGQFIKPILAMQTSPTPETYKNAFEKIGTGELPPRYQEIALSYALDRPIPEMDGILNEAVGKATNAQGKAALLKAQQEFEGKKRVAEELSKSLILEAASAEKLKEFDRTTVALVSTNLLKRPDNQLRRMNVDRTTLSQLSRTRPIRVTELTR